MHDAGSAAARRLQRVRQALQQGTTTKELCSLSSRGAGERRCSLPELLEHLSAVRPRHGLRREQGAHELPLLVLGLSRRALVALLVGPVRLLAQQTRDEGAAGAAVAQRAAADGELGEIVDFPCVGTHVVVLRLSEASNG